MEEVKYQLSITSIHPPFYPSTTPPFHMPPFFLYQDSLDAGRNSSYNGAMKKSINVLEGDIKQLFFKMAIPSMWGMFAITLFNLTDTYFVSRLGTDALAAMGFTFPVVMVIGAFSGGISMGAGSVLARAMGRGDLHKMNRIVTDGILLSMLMVLFVSAFGLFFVEEIFRSLGAEGEALNLVVQYMSIWFGWAAVVIVPPVSDASMRAMGDMIRPLAVMLSVAVLNVILDPILIFGLFGMPAMGIRGAIIATVVSRIIGGGLSLAFVAIHYKRIDFKYDSLKDLTDSWKEILAIGIPNVIVRILPQAIRASMTRLAAATAGVTAVAAIAAGQRIESFATIASMGIGTAIVPIVGQNFGKGKMDRVMTTRHLLIRFAVIYGLALFLITLPLGRVLAGIFTDNPAVLEQTVIYIRIVMLATIGLNQYNWISEAFNAAGKPKFSLVVNAAGTVLIILPSVLFGAFVSDFRGMLIGLAIGQLLVGGMAVWLSKERLAS